MVRDVDGLERRRHPGLRARALAELAVQGRARRDRSAVAIGGVTVNPGDIVVGDQDGIVVVRARSARGGGRRARGGESQGSEDGRAGPPGREAARPGLDTDDRGEGRPLPGLSGMPQSSTSVPHATREVYASSAPRCRRDSSSSRSSTNDDAERKRKIADCEVVIVASYPLRRDVIDAAGRLRARPPPGRGVPGHADLAALKSTRHSARAHPRGDDDRRRRAHGAADARGRASSCRSPTASCARGASTSTRCGPPRASSPA